MMEPPTVTDAERASAHVAVVPFKTLGASAARQ
jgi:hypothetical protein